MLLSLFASVILFIRFPNILGADCKDPEMHCDLSNSTFPYFDMKKFGEYNGKWWVQNWYDHNDTIKCLHMSFTVKGTNEIIVDAGWLSSRYSTKYIISRFRLRQPDPPSWRRFRMHTNRSFDWFALGTDYKTFLVVFVTDVNEGKCNKLRRECLTSIQILTAEQDPPYYVYQTAYQVANSYGLKKRHFWPINQTNCPSF